MTSAFAFCQLDRASHILRRFHLALTLCGHAGVYSLRFGFRGHALPMSACTAVFCLIIGGLLPLVVLPIVGTQQVPKVEDNAKPFTIGPDARTDRFKQQGGIIRPVGNNTLLPSLQSRNEWRVECNWDQFTGTAKDLSDVLSTLHVVELSVSQGIDGAQTAAFLSNVSPRTLRSVELRGFVLNHDLIHTLSQKFDDVSYLCIHGEISDRSVKALNDLQHLDELDICSSAITDHGVRTVLEKATKLKALRLRGFSTCGRWVSAAPTGITDIRLEKCVFGKGATLSGLKIQPLEFCSLNCSSGVSDEVVATLSACSSLQGLDLTGTCVTSCGVAVLSHIESLDTLVLRNCRFVDEQAVASLEGMHALHRVSVEGTGVSEKSASAMRARNPTMIVSSSGTDRWSDPFVGGSLPID